MHKTFGSILIIAGTTIGAGMLALPIEARSIGFMPSVALSLLLWMFTYYVAKLTIDLFVRYPQHKTLPSLAGHLLGPVGQIAAGFALYALFYSLLAAYCAGSASLFSLWFSDLWSVLLSAVPIVVLTHLRFNVVDCANRFLFLLMIGVFGVLIVSLTPHIQVAQLITHDFLSIRGAMVAVFFTAFGFHGSIPVIMHYTSHNKETLHRIFFWGSLIPLAVYILWLGIGFGITGGTATNLKDFVRMLTESSACHAVLKQSINMFSLLAIITSFLGVALSLFDLIDAWMPNIPLRHYAITCTTFAPAFLFAYWSAFEFALRYAGAALTLFAVILPALMCLRYRWRFGPMITLLFGLCLVLFTLFRL